MNFVYWKVKGRSEPIRYTFEYLGIEYKEINPKSGKEWYGEMKPKLLEKMDFPNLPYL